MSAIMPNQKPAQGSVSEPKNSNVKHFEIQELDVDNLFPKDFAKPRLEDCRGSDCRGDC